MNNEEVVQILKAINILTEEVRDEKRKNEKRWEENEKRWEENEKRWQENERRWEENERRWEENERRWQENEKRWAENENRWKENNKSWEEYRKNRKKDKEDILNILLSFQNSVENMYKENKERIIKIEQKCPNCKIKAI